MAKTRVLLVLGGVLLVLVAAAVFGCDRYHQIDKLPVAERFERSALESGNHAEKAAYAAGREELGNFVSAGPISKNVLLDDEGVIYSLRAVVVTPFVYSSQVFPSAKVYLAGDPLKREFKVITGDLTNEVYIGEYKEPDLSGGSVWRPQDYKAFQEIQPVELIELQATLSLRTANEVNGYKETVEALDRLAMEFDRQDFAYELPNELYFLAHPGALQSTTINGLEVKEIQTGKIKFKASV